MLRCTRNIGPLCLRHACIYLCLSLYPDYFISLCTNITNTHTHITKYPYIHTYIHNTNTQTHAYTHAHTHAHRHGKIDVRVVEVKRSGSLYSRKIYLHAPCGKLLAHAILHAYLDRLPLAVTEGVCTEKIPFGKLLMDHVKERCVKLKVCMYVCMYSCMYVCVCTEKIPLGKLLMDHVKERCVKPRCVCMYVCVCVCTYWKYTAWQAFDGSCEGEVCETQGVYACMHICM